MLHIASQAAMSTHHVNGEPTLLCLQLQCSELL